ncbi:hypothetical protein B0H21DRAFT_696084 [Amylocystis lapponica]|nr:hypothetical protein B0H21DRAFT_696084 [Amylocystis lapponica]
MAYLVRRDRTHLLRMLCFPAVVVLAVRCTCAYTWEGPGGYLQSKHITRLKLKAVSLCGVLNPRRPGLVALTVTAKALDFALAKRGRFKVGETRLPGIGEPVSPSLATRQSPAPETGPGQKTARLPAWLADALEVAFAMRGIGWDFGQGLHVPQTRRPAERGPFLRATARAIAQTFLRLDAAGTVLRALPGLLAPAGGSLFLPQLPPAARYALSTALHTLAGFIIMWGIDLLYDSAAFLAVAVLAHPPRAWPPAQDCPPRACSLHAFWAARWHQLLRHTFLTCGGGLAGGAGRVVGAFLASGAYHEAAMQRADHRVALFFALQAVGVLLEKAYRARTGRRVGGVAGWLWTAVFVLGLGQMCTDAFVKDGMARGLVLPEELSPVSRVLSLVLRRWTTLDSAGA